MHNLPPLLVMDYVGPIVSACIFVLVMSLVKEPARRTFNAIFAAGASWRVSAVVDSVPGNSSILRLRLRSSISAFGHIVSSGSHG